MNVKDLIIKTCFDDVMRVISMHYGNEEESLQRELYCRLKTMEAASNEDGLTIYINAVFIDDNDEEVVLSEFDEYDTSLYFDVSGFQEEDDIVYSIAASSYEDLLGYFISDETKKSFSDESILAHILWEATAYSYEDFNG